MSNKQDKQDTRNFLTRDTILAITDLTTREVHVPEWGGWVVVKALTGEERERYEESLIVGRGKKRKVKLEGARARLVVASVIDQNGQPVFTLRDVKELSKKSAAALDRISKVAQELSGIGDDELDDAKDDLKNE